MKKYFIIISANLILLFLSVGVLAEKQADFRNTHWGMTKDEVTNIEGTTYVSQKDTLCYRGTVNNKECAILYTFYFGKLYLAGYLFFQTYNNPNDYIDDYNKLKGLLTQKYGNPIEEKVNWKNTRYKNDPEQYGKALIKGDLEFKNYWENERTEIMMKLYRNNKKKIKIIITYKSKNKNPPNNDDPLKDL